MSINPAIRDQAYRFFIEEAPELLQAIEAGLLTLKQERSIAKVHDLMRAAHSIKGGAASVELDAIATLAHRLETIFKALYNDDLEIDTELEDGLLNAYDCLRLPLMEQIASGIFDATQALALADPIFSRIEEQLGEAFTQAENYLPSSADLGIDVAVSLFEIDVAEGLDRLATVLARPQDYEVAGELLAQAEVFSGFAELLNLPGFGAIAQSAIAALTARPDRALDITQVALADWQAGQQAVLAGDRAQGGSPSAALVALAKSPAMEASKPIEPPTTVPSLDVDRNAVELDVVELDAPQLDGTELDAIEWDTTEAAIAPPLEDVFSSPEPPVVSEVADLPDLLVAASEDNFQDRNSRDPNAQDCNVQDRNSDADVGDTAAAFSLEDIFGHLEHPLSEVEENEQHAEAASHDELIETVLEATLEATPGATKDETVGLRASALSKASIFSTSAQPWSEQPSSEASERDAQNDEPATLEATVQAIKQSFDSLPKAQDVAARASQSDTFGLESGATPTISQRDENNPAYPDATGDRQNNQPVQNAGLASDKLNQGSTPKPPRTAVLSVRVDLERLERMNNQMGELAINRNSLALQNEQLQRSVRELLRRFAQFQTVVGRLQDLSDQMLIAPERYWEVGSEKTKEGGRSQKLGRVDASLFPLQSDFDSLEMDSYGTIHSSLQEALEKTIQIEEAVDDIALFAGQSNRTIDQQRQMLAQLQNELMWSRMLPLGEVLNRFPRVLRDLAAAHGKLVNLKLKGTGVLVDKAVLEKLYDPLLHLLRNAFDHGIEPLEIRRQQGKPEQGEITIRAYHQGNQTIIEVKDDGRGLDLDGIGRRAVELGLLSPEQLAVTANNRLLDFIFEPGFSTASRISDLSGRGVGLDVVRSQLRSLKGTVTATSSPGKGTTFTLRLPLTLTIAKLLVCLVGQTALALPADSIEEILVPRAGQVQSSAEQRFLRWREQLVPTYRLADLLDHGCPLPELSPSKALVAVPMPENWASPLLLIRREQQSFALEIDRVVTEQELTIKPFGTAIAAPDYAYGCTILGDGSLVLAIDGASLIDWALKRNPAPAKAARESEVLAAIANNQSATDPTESTHKPGQVHSILIVDDSAALRRTLALTLQKAGYRVLQARDGREAIDQLQQGTAIQMVICDIEMPNMNGFDFLSQRRQDSQLSAIPVAMLTSRSNDKHRRLAMHLGANAYFTKPYIEQEFLGAIANTIAQNADSSNPTLQTIS